MARKYDPKDGGGRGGNSRTPRTNPRQNQDPGRTSPPTPTRPEPNTRPTNTDPGRSGNASGRSMFNWGLGQQEPQAGEPLGGYLPDVAGDEVYGYGGRMGTMDESFEPVPPPAPEAPVAPQQAAPAFNPTLPQFRYSDNQYLPTQRTGGPAVRGSGSSQELAENDRMQAYHRGDALDQDYVTDVNESKGRQNFYEQQGYNQYAPFLNGGGGYTADENAAILGQDRLDQMQLTQEEADSYQLTPEEQSAIQGNPDLAYRYFQPDRERAIQGEGINDQRGAVNGLRDGLDGAVDADRMRVSDQFLGGLGDVVTDTGGRVREALGSPDLDVSGQFLNDYRMDPNEQQDIVTGAGIGVRNRYGAASDELSRNARAAGMNPAGVAVMRQRFERQAAGDSADAQTMARINASNAAAERLRTGEDMRVRYGQNLAGMRADAEQRFGQFHADAGLSGEGLRVNAEQGLSGIRSDNARVSGLAALDTERGIANTRLGTEQRTTDIGIGLDQGADDRRAERSAMLGTNRQNASVNLANNRFDRRAYADQATTNRTGAVAGARRQDQQEARGWVTGMQGQANNNAQAGLDRRGNLYGTQGNLVGGSTRTKSVAEGTPGKGERIFAATLGGAQGAFSGAFGGGGEKGGIVTKPTYMLLGEAGPEAVVPLGLQDDSEVLPSLTMQPGSFDTAPPMRGASAYSYRYKKAS
jgi:hypothetical protein